MSTLMRWPLFSLVAITPVLWSASPAAARDESRAYSSRALLAQNRESCSNYEWYRKCKTESPRDYCCKTIQYDVPNCVCD
jgi:hypothetical protein